MSDATRLQHLQYAAIEAINALVECRGVSFEDRHSAIELVRAHLEARAEQTAVDAISEEMHRDSSYADVGDLNDDEQAPPIDNSDLL